MSVMNPYIDNNPKDRDFHLKMLADNIKGLAEKGIYPEARDWVFSMAGEDSIFPQRAQVSKVIRGESYAIEIRSYKKHNRKSADYWGIWAYNLSINHNDISWWIKKFNNGEDLERYGKTPEAFFHLINSYFKAIEKVLEAKDREAEIFSKFKAAIIRDIRPEAYPAEKMDDYFKIENLGNERIFTESHPTRKIKLWNGEFYLSYEYNIETDTVSIYTPEACPNHYRHPFIEEFKYNALDELSKEKNAIYEALKELEKEYLAKKKELENKREELEKQTDDNINAELNRYLHEK